MENYEKRIVTDNLTINSGLKVLSSSSSVPQPGSTGDERKELSLHRVPVRVQVSSKNFSNSKNFKRTKIKFPYHFFGILQLIRLTS